MAALDALPDGVVVADAQGRVTHVNEVARRQLGLDEGVGPGLPLAEVVRLQDRNGRDWWTFATPYDGLPSRTGLPESVWLLPDGTEVLVTGRLGRRRSGGPVTEVGLVIRSARGRERLDRERSDLVATVAHELRSPLSGLRGFVTTMLTKWDLLRDDQKLLLLQTVNNDAERLGRLIHELLDVARIDTGRLPLSPRPVDLTDVVERVLATARLSTGRTLVARHAQRPLRVLADPDKLVQVVTNLVENAVRHGEGRVTVATALITDRDSEQVEVTVGDEGPGIHESVRRRVFTKFWRDQASAGSGLGMYIVHGLVSAHGGTVTIEDHAASASGTGALVRVWLPAGTLR